MHTVSSCHYLVHRTRLESACYASEHDKFDSRNGNIVRPHCHNDVDKGKEMPTVSVGTCSSNKRHSFTSSLMRTGQSPVSAGTCKWPHVSDFWTSTDGHTHTILISLSEYQYRHSEWVMYVDRDSLNRPRNGLFQLIKIHPCGGVIFITPLGH